MVIVKSKNAMPERPVQFCVSFRPHGSFGTHCEYPTTLGAATARVKELLAQDVGATLKITPAQPAEPAAFDIGIDGNTLAFIASALEVAAELASIHPEEVKTLSSLAKHIREALA